MKMENLIGVKAENGEILGKFLYYSLSNVLIEREQMKDICKSLNFPSSGITRTSVTDAFRSATGDIYERIVNHDGIFKVYCRDNKRVDGNLISRELVKETLGQSTNQYKKLANINYIKDCNVFDCQNVDYDYDVDIQKYCTQAEEFFQLYQNCLSRSQIDGIIERYINSMNALHISIKGKLFFVPKSHMHMVDTLEDFISELNRHNKHNTQVTVNSMFVVDSSKQRKKMADEFYANVRKDIELYQEKINYLISSCSESSAIMNRWINKITALEDKKRMYEDILKRELVDLDDEFSDLKFLSQELQLRAKKYKRAA